MVINKKTAKYIYITGFLVSAILSINLFKDMAFNRFQAIVFIAMAIIFETSKLLFFVAAANSKINKSYRKISFLIWIVLVLFSVFASMSLLVNQSNKAENDKILNSSVYKLTQEEIKLEQETINMNMEELKKLKNVDVIGLFKDDEQYNNYIKLANEAKSKNIITHKTQGYNHYMELANNRKSEIENLHNKRIEDLENNINISKENINKSSVEIKNIDTASIKDTIGYKAILSSIANILNKAKLYIWSEWDVETLETLLSLSISVMIEFIVSTMYFISSGGIDVIEKTKEIETKKDEDGIFSKAIGFLQKNKNIKIDETLAKSKLEDINENEINDIDKKKQ